MNLDELRRIIDGIDNDLVELLNARASCALSIGREKENKGAPVHDPQREGEVLSRVKQVNAGPLEDDSLATIYREIISACLRVQGKESPNQ